MTDDHGRLPTPAAADAAPDDPGPSGGPDRLLRISGMSKAYGSIQALDHVDFELQAGEVMGLVGENGAGKSTLVKILAGLVRPDGGEILLEDPRSAMAKPCAAPGSRSSSRSSASSRRSRRPRTSFLGIPTAASSRRPAASSLGRGRSWPRSGSTTSIRRSPPATSSSPNSSSSRSLVSSRATPGSSSSTSRPRPCPTRRSGASRRSSGGSWPRDARSSTSPIAWARSSSSRIASRSSAMAAANHPCRSATSRRASWWSACSGRFLENLFPPRSAGIGDGVVELRAVLGAGLTAPVDLVARAGEIVGLAGQVGSGAAEPPGPRRRCAPAALRGRRRRRNHPSHRIAGRGQGARHRLLLGRPQA